MVPLSFDLGQRPLPALLCRALRYWKKLDCHVHAVIGYDGSLFDYVPCQD